MFFFSSSPMDLKDSHVRWRACQILYVNVINCRTVAILLENIMTWFWVTSNDSLARNLNVSLLVLTERGKATGNRWKHLPFQRKKRGFSKDECQQFTSTSLSWFGDISFFFQTHMRLTTIATGGWKTVFFLILRRLHPPPPHNNFEFITVLSV